MPTPPPETRPHPWLRRAVYLLAALAGLKYGYDFGYELSGTLFGVLMGVNAAVFAALMAEGLLSRMPGLRRSGRDRDGA